MPAACRDHAAPATPCPARTSASSPRRSTLEADEVFLDLEDAVAPNEKDSARERVIEALRTLDFGAKTVVVRVNGTDTPHYYNDLIAVVEQAGEHAATRSCCRRCARPATSR